MLRRFKAPDRMIDGCSVVSESFILVEGLLERLPKVSLTQYVDERLRVLCMFVRT